MPGSGLGRSVRDAGSMVGAWAWMRASSGGGGASSTAMSTVTGEGRVIGCEADHMTLVQSEKLNAFLKPTRGVDISAGTMTQRMKKSVAELEMIRHGAGVADVGGFAIREAVKEGAIATKAGTPLWIMVLGALGLAVGLALYGARLIRTVGKEITELDNMRAYSIAMAATLTVIVASQLGMPVSTTHVTIGAVFGVGFLRELLKVNYAKMEAVVFAGHQGQDRAEVEALVRRDHHHPPVLNGRMELQEAEGLGREAVVEAGIGPHLHLQQHHRQLRGIMPPVHHRRTEHQHRIIQQGPLAFLHRLQLLDLAPHQRHAGAQVGQLVRCAAADAAATAGDDHRLTGKEAGAKHGFVNRLTHGLVSFVMSSGSQHEIAVAKGDGLIGAGLPCLDAQVRHTLAQLDHHDVGIGVLRTARAQVINVEIDGLGQVPAVHVPQQVEQSGALQKPPGGSAMQSRQDGVAYQFFLEW